MGCIYCAVWVVYCAVWASMAVWVGLMRNASMLTSKCISQLILLLHVYASLISVIILVFFV
mgnify:CR=1